jgi:hypothetical protein
MRLPSGAQLCLIPTSRVNGVSWRRLVPSDAGGEQGLPEVLPVEIDEAQLRPVRVDLGVGHAAACAGRDQVAVCAGEVHAPDRLHVGDVVETPEEDPGPVGAERRRTLAAVQVAGEVGEAAAVGVHEDHRAPWLTGGVIKLERDPVPVGGPVGQERAAVEMGDLASVAPRRSQSHCWAGVPGRALLVGVAIMLGCEPSPGARGFARLREITRSHRWIP